MRKSNYIIVIPRPLPAPSREASGAENRRGPRAAFWAGAADVPWRCAGCAWGVRGAPCAAGFCGFCGFCGTGPSPHYIACGCTLLPRCGCTRAAGSADRLRGSINDASGRATPRPVNSLLARAPRRCRCLRRTRDRKGLWHCAVFRTPDRYRAHRVANAGEPLIRPLFRDTLRHQRVRQLRVPAATIPAGGLGTR